MIGKLIHHRRVILIRMEKKNTYYLIRQPFSITFPRGWKKKERNVPNGSAISFSSHDYRFSFLHVPVISIWIFTFHQKQIWQIAYELPYVSRLHSINVYTHFNFIIHNEKQWQCARFARKMALVYTDSGKNWDCHVFKQVFTVVKNLLIMFWRVSEVGVGS